LSWMVARLHITDRSPLTGGAEVKVTVTGIATGIMPYLSQERRRAGWLSAVLLTIASCIQPTDHGIQAVERCTLSATAALLV